MRRLAIVLSLVLLSASLAAQQQPRLIAVGDIHGSITGMTAILRTAGLVDATNKWTGAKTVFMQTGDYMDRGEDVRAVLDLLMALEPQAKSAGGRAFALLGNHEVMNLLGETRDANPPIFAKFADAQSEARRQKGWKDYSAIGAAKLAKGEAVPDVYRQPEDKWMESHPPGFIEYRDAIGPKGKYGAWLRGKPMVTITGGSIFMHAGIPPATAPAKIDELNDQLKDEVRRMDRFVQRLVDRKLALPFFTLQEVVQVALVEVQAANALLTAAKESGQQADRAL
ncbi:MAG: metallophosphoesterase, partial [Vicinamibacterales bacterium]